MSEMDEMRSMNKKPIAEANSTKTLSGGAAAKSNRYAENKARQTTLHAKAQARSKAAAARRAGER
jgi:hypothetical protein